MANKYFPARAFPTVSRGFPRFPVGSLFRLAATQGGPVDCRLFGGDGAGGAVGAGGLADAFAEEAGEVLGGGEAALAGDFFYPEGGGAQVVAGGADLDVLLVLLGGQAVGGLEFATEVVGGEAGFAGEFVEGEGVGEAALDAVADALEGMDGNTMNFFFNPSAQFMTNQEK
jgi:hypothetical protein